MTSAGTNQEAGVKGVAPLALLALVKDDKCLVRDVPLIAGISLTADIQLAPADVLVVGDKERLDSGKLAYLFPARHSCLGREDDGGNAEAGSYFAADIGLACAGVASVKGYSVRAKESAFDALGVVFLIV